MRACRWTACSSARSSRRAASRSRPGRADPSSRAGKRPSFAALRGRLAIAVPGPGSTHQRRQGTRLGRERAIESFFVETAGTRSLAIRPLDISVLGPILELIGPVHQLGIVGLESDVAQLVANLKSPQVVGLRLGTSHAGRGGRNDLLLVLLFVFPAEFAGRAVEEETRKPIPVAPARLLAQPDACHAQAEADRQTSSPDVPVSHVRPPFAQFPGSADWSRGVGANQLPCSCNARVWRRAYARIAAPCKEETSAFFGPTQRQRPGSAGFPAVVQK